MIKQYQEELKALKEKMAGAEKFAEKIPLFRQFILDNKLDGTEGSVKRINKRSEGLLMDCYNWVADVLRLH